MADPLEEERRKEQRRDRMRSRARERANTYFEIYYAFGPDRSLIMLHDHLAALGLKISLNTLKNYSSWFSWQQELLKRDAIMQQKRKAQTANIVEVMNRRQADLGSAYQSIAAGGIKNYLDALKGNEPLKISPLVSAQIAQIGQKMERLARGEVTDRKEAIQQINDIWVLVVSQTFLAVNDYADPRVRKEEFAIRMEQFLNEQKVQLERGRQ